MSERSHCHTEGNVNLPIISDNLLFCRLLVFLFLVIILCIYIHTVHTYVYSNFILSEYSAGLVLIVIRIMYSMAASMASEAQIKLNHNFTLSLLI